MASPSFHQEASSSHPEVKLHIVRALDGEELSLYSVAETDNIASIKRWIEDDFGVPFHEQQLLSESGSVLMNDVLLKDAEPTLTDSKVTFKLLRDKTQYYTNLFADDSC